MTTNANRRKAVIYCYGSNTKQLMQGNGLSRQETKCRAYASFRDLEVVKVFTDDVSDGLANRPGMQEMLSFLRSKHDSPHEVIVDDIGCLAHDLPTHLELRRAISGAGGTLVSPSVVFGEDSESELVEILLASAAQHHQQKHSASAKDESNTNRTNQLVPEESTTGD